MILDLIKVKARLRKSLPSIDQTQLQTNRLVDLISISLKSDQLVNLYHSLSLNQDQGQLLAKRGLIQIQKQLHKTNLI